MKLKLDGTLGIIILMVMEALKLEIPEELESGDGTGGTQTTVPVVGEPDPEQEFDEGTLGNVQVVGGEEPITDPVPEPVQQVIEHTIFPSPIVLFDDTETDRLAREETVLTTTPDTSTVVTRTIHQIV